MLKIAYKMAFRTACRKFSPLRGQREWRLPAQMVSSRGRRAEKGSWNVEKCAWPRSERQPFCDGLALNDWRAEAAQRGRLAASAQCARVCAHYVPTCLPLQVSVVRCKVAFKVAQRACTLSHQLRSELLYVAGHCPTSFLCTAPWRTIWRASFCGP